MSNRSDDMIGSPETDARVWDGQQSFADTCAIRSQEFILEQFTGAEIDEGDLVQEAIDHGWYTPGEGTDPNHVGELLRLHGVEVHQTQNATILQLASELGQGHKVIVGVDSGELWKQNPILEQISDYFGFDGADHAVVVSGIDTSDPNNPHVIISDPGTGEVAHRYPLDEFLDAWSDSEFFMVSTNEPAPPHLPEMAHFDYEAGHLPEMLGLEWDSFAAMEHQPADFEGFLHDYMEEFSDLYQGEEASLHNELLTGEDFGPTEFDDGLEGFI